MSQSSRDGRTGASRPGVLRKWWWVLPAGAGVVLVIVGAVIGGGELEDEPMPERPDVDVEQVSEDEWRIVTYESDDGGTYDNVHMIKTFSPLDEADVEDVSARLVWPDTELELCEVTFRSVGEGVVQVGGYFPQEPCEQDMVDAFEQHGLPESGCVVLVVAGVVDEYCAELAVERWPNEPDES